MNMRYMGDPSVQVAAWVKIDEYSEITYRVYPVQDTVEFTLGGRDELEMQTDEAGLRHCLAAFTGALAALEAAIASQPDAAPC